MPARIAARPQALPSDVSGLRTLADQAFSRTAGAPLVGGNAVRVLRDARENYPAWEAAIASAHSTVHLEMYIVRRDPVGRRFVALLTEKARQGIKVRLIYDWFGCGTAPLLGLFGPLIAAGGDVRAFNPPSIRAALGWVRRDHRKLLAVDGRIAFIGGLCISQAWEGVPARNQEPWRDTAVEITGLALKDVEAAFAESWRLAGGDRISASPTPDDPVETGSVALRLIPTEPFTANVLRLDLLITSLARRSLWITDAYFIGTGAYIAALQRAARDGVDVRLLLPRGSDVSWTVPVSRSLYRPLLSAGVRIFEWDGTMIHAKTAVADGRWSRIGSTNLNLNSWIGNWELDVAIEDDAVAQTMATHYEEDLSRATEIVIDRPAARPKPAALAGGPAKPPMRHRTSRRVVRAMNGVGHSISAAVSGNRPLEAFELTPIFTVAALLGLMAIIGFVTPRLFAWPVAAFALWISVTLLAEAWDVWRRSRRS